MVSRACLSLALAAHASAAVVAFAGGKYSGWEQWDWSTITHLGFWTQPSGEVRLKAKENHVRLFQNHHSDCSLDCYTDPAAIAEGVQNVLQQVSQYDLDGVFFDEERSFTEINQKQKDGYGALVKGCADALRPLNKTVFVCVGGRPSYEFRGYDYSDMAATSEFLFIMGYDMHFWDDYSCVLNGECSPAEAPLPDVKKGVEQYMKQVPAGKLVLGLPWYGQRYMSVAGLPINEGQVDYKTALDWLDQKSPRSKKKVENDQAWKVVCDGSCEPGTTRTGGVLWFDDAETLAPKYALARDNNLLGVGVWKVDDLPYDGSHNNERDAMWAALRDWQLEAQLL